METVAVALLNGSKVAERWELRALNEASLKEFGFLPEAGKQYFIWSLIAARGPRVAHQTNCNGTAPLGFPARSRGRHGTEAVHGHSLRTEKKRNTDSLFIGWEEQHVLNSRKRGLQNNSRTPAGEWMGNRHE